MTGTRDCDVALVELDKSRATAQPPRRLTTQRSWLHPFPGMDARRQHPHLRCVRADLLPWLVARDYRWQSRARAHRGRRRAATAPALARSRDRLAFTRLSLDTDIYRFEADVPVQLVAGSSFVDSIRAYRLTAVGSRLPPGGRPAREWTSGLLRLTDRTRSNSPMVLESVRASPGRPTGGGLPLTRRGRTPRTPIVTCG